MSVRFFFPTATAKNITKGKKVIEVEGDTIGNIISKVITTYPEMRRILFTGENKLRGYIKVLINDKFIASDVLEQKVNDGDDIRLFFVMGGG